MESHLRKLARRHYDGKLSQAEYRQARRMMLRALLDGEVLQEETTLPVAKQPSHAVDDKSTQTQPVNKTPSTDTQPLVAPEPVRPDVHQKEKRSQPKAVYFIMVVILVMTGGVTYWMLMQPGQPDDVGQTASTGQQAIKPAQDEPVAPQSEAQQLAEELIYADVWSEDKVNLLIEKISAKDFSHQAWYWQLKEAVQTRQELAQLDNDLTAGSEQNQIQLNRLAMALGLNAVAVVNEAPMIEQPELASSPEEPLTVASETIEFPELKQETPVVEMPEPTVEPKQMQTEKLLVPEKTPPASETEKVVSELPRQAQAKTLDQPWEVALIVLRDKQKIQEQQQLLLQHGIQASIAELLSKPDHWRLYVGGYAAQSDAQKVAEKIKQLNLGYGQLWVRQTQGPVEKQNTKTAIVPQSKDSCLGQQALTRKPYCRDELADGLSGPRLVILPPGHFTMGSLLEPSTSPERKVMVNRSFAITESEITYADYEKYCQSTGTACPAASRQGQYPVTHVSWYDAINYANWLSQQTGQKYRLPSEAEWEYACRGGTQTEYPFAQGVTPTNAKFNSPDGSSESTSNNKNYNKNGFRLYHMVGNVREWVQDAWQVNHAGAPDDARPRTSGTFQRVVRGGSYQDPAIRLRSAARQGLASSNSDKTTGFRLVREIAH